MRELEFLPTWYPQARSRKRMLMIQTHMTIVVVSGLMLWMWLVHRNTRVAAAELGDINLQLGQTQRELHQLQDQVALKNQLLIQRQIGEKLGLPVEMSRMLSILVDEKIPKEMSLTDLSFDTQEQVKVANTLDAARNVNRGGGVERTLRVRLQGVTPSDNDVANLLTGLAVVPFFEQVAMTYSRDRAENGHIMREFEVTFMLNLNQSVGG